MINMGFSPIMRQAFWAKAHFKQYHGPCSKEQGNSFPYLNEIARCDFENLY